MDEVLEDHRAVVGQIELLQEVVFLGGGHEADLSPAFVPFTVDIDEHEVSRGRHLVAVFAAGHHDVRVVDADGEAKDVLVRGQASDLAVTVRLRREHLALPDGGGPSALVGRERDDRAAVHER